MLPEAEDVLSIPRAIAHFASFRKIGESTEIFQTHGGRKFIPLGTMKQLLLRDCPMKRDGLKVLLLSPLFLLVGVSANAQSINGLSRDAMASLKSSVAVKAIAVPSHQASDLRTPIIAAGQRTVIQRELLGLSSMLC